MQNSEDYDTTENLTRRGHQRKLMGRSRRALVREAVKKLMVNIGGRLLLQVFSLEQQNWSDSMEKSAQPSTLQYWKKTC